jgi:hypothetical protein
MKKTIIHEKYSKAPKKYHNPIPHHKGEDISTKKLKRKDYHKANGTVHVDKSLLREPANYNEHKKEMDCAINADQ